MNVNWLCCKSGLVVGSGGEKKRKERSDNRGKLQKALFVLLFNHMRYISFSLGNQLPDSTLPINVLISVY